MTTMSFANEDRLLLQRATSTVLVPAQNDVPINVLLEGQAEIEQRSNIYFGMLLVPNTRPISYSSADQMND